MFGKGKLYEEIELRRIEIANLEKQKSVFEETIHQLKKDVFDTTEQLNKQVFGLTNSLGTAEEALAISEAKVKGFQESTGSKFSAKFYEQTEARVAAKKADLNRRLESFSFEQAAFKKHRAEQEALFDKCFKLVEAAGLALKDKAILEAVDDVGDKNPEAKPVESLNGSAEESSV